MHVLVPTLLRLHARTRACPRIQTCTASGCFDICCRDKTAPKQLSRDYTALQCLVHAKGVTASIQGHTGTVLQGREQGG